MAYGWKPEPAGFWGFFPKACKLVNAYSMQGGVPTMTFAAALAGLFTWMGTRLLTILVEMALYALGLEAGASKIEEATDFVAVVAIAFVVFLLGFHEGVIGYRHHLAKPLVEAQQAYEDTAEPVATGNARQYALERRFEAALRPALEQHYEEIAKSFRPGPR